MTANTGECINCNQKVNFDMSGWVSWYFVKGQRFALKMTVHIYYFDYIIFFFEHHLL